MPAEDLTMEEMGISVEESLELKYREELLLKEADGDYPKWDEMKDQKLVEALLLLREDERKLIYQHVFRIPLFDKIRQSKRKSNRFIPNSTFQIIHTISCANPHVIKAYSAYSPEGCSTYWYKIFLISSCYAYTDLCNSIRLFSQITSLFSIHLTHYIALSHAF